MRPYIFRRDVYRGDKWTQTITFTQSGQDWDSATVEAVIKDDVDGTTVHTFTPSVSTSGETLTAVLSIAGSDTAGFTLGELVMDVEVTANDFGPYTPVKFYLEVIGDVTE